MRPALLKIAFNRLLCLASNDGHSLAAAFAGDAELGGGLALLRSKRGEFAYSQAGRVKRFEDRPVAEAEGGLLVRRGEELLDVLLIEEPRQAAALAGGGDADGRVGLDQTASAKVAVDGAEGGELAGDGGASVVLGVEVGEESSDVGWPQFLPRAGEPMLADKRGELLEVVGVGAHRRLRSGAAVAKFGQECVNEVVHCLIGLPYDAMAA